MICDYYFDRNKTANLIKCKTQAKFYINDHKGYFWGACDFCFKELKLRTAPPYLDTISETEAKLLLIKGDPND